MEYYNFFTACLLCAPIEVYGRHVEATNVQSLKCSEWYFEAALRTAPCDPASSPASRPHWAHHKARWGAVTWRGVGRGPGRTAH